MEALPNTFLVRKAVSAIKLVVMGSIFFTLPAYGMGLGIGMPASKLTWVTILDNWFDLIGTQTPPPDVKPVLYTAFGLSILADLAFLFIRRPGSTVLQVARTFDYAAGIIAAVCGELLLEHVESNTSSNVLAPQTAAFGSLISVMMILVFVPLGYELVVLFDKKTPDGD